MPYRDTTKAPEAMERCVPEPGKRHKHKGWTDLEPTKRSLKLEESPGRASASSLQERGMISSLD